MPSDHLLWSDLAEQVSDEPSLSKAASHPCTPSPASQPSHSQIEKLYLSFWVFIASEPSYPYSPPLAFSTPSQLLLHTMTPTPKFLCIHTPVHTHSPMHSHSCGYTHSCAHTPSYTGLQKHSQDTWVFYIPFPWGFQARCPHACSPYQVNSRRRCPGNWTTGWGLRLEVGSRDAQADNILKIALPSGSGT